MSDEIPDQRTRAVINLVNAHLAKRREAALAKINGTDSAAVKKRDEVRNHERYQLQALVETALIAVDQIQLASHLLKPTYPDGKVRMTSNLNIMFSRLPKQLCLGSHVLQDEITRDTTGNGAYVTKIYELVQCLELSFEGRSLREWLIEEDAEVMTALGCIGENGSAVLGALIRVHEDRCPRPSSHSNAKQLYWQVGQDAHDDASYHLLAPLFPTSLVHRVYQQLQDDRFSEEAKAAREARRNGTHHERPVREYPQMAIQKLGGTKPQNISQLNSERRGDNCLLASVPPIWKSAAVRPLLNINSLFKVYGRRPEVKEEVAALREFLKKNPPANMDTRQRVRKGVQRLVDEMLVFQAELLTLEPGWSQAEDCNLSAAQRIWLDPDGQQPESTAQEDVADEVAADFARWFNNQLRDPLLVGDPEFLEWRKLAKEQFAAHEREAA